MRTLAGLIVLTLLVLLFLSSKGEAANLGVYGTVYEISEQDLLEFIKQKLTAMQDSGELAKQQQYMKEKAIESIKHPKSLPTITKATEDKEWTYDPSITLQEDLKDQDGRVFYKAGTKANPLEYTSMTNQLLFIDGNDEEQVAWAMKITKELNGKTKIILVGGAIMDLMDKHQVRMYFDQKGQLTSKFSITHVPALVKQQGLLLLVQEVKL